MLETLLFCVRGFLSRRRREDKRWHIFVFFYEKKDDAVLRLFSSNNKQLTILPQCMPQILELVISDSL